MIHCALLHIRLAKRFFALREIGVTSAVFMNLDAFCMCVFYLMMQVSSRLCVPLVRLSHLDEIVELNLVEVFISS